MTKEDNLLSLIPFRQTIDWNIKQFFHTSAIHSPFAFRKLREVLTRRKDKMVVEDHLRYKRITIKTNCGGVMVRDEVPGTEIKTKAQYYILPGQLAVSKIDARNGAFGIVPPEADHAIITGNFWVYEVDPTLAHVDYLILLLSSRFFVQAWQDCSNGSGNRLYLQEQKFLDYEIPLPDVSVQETLVQTYRKISSEAERRTGEAARLEQDIDNYLWETLMIVPVEPRRAAHTLLGTTRFKRLIGWGANTNSNTVKPQEVFQSTRYKNLPLEVFCQVNPITKYPSALREISFVPMECVSDVYGEITAVYDGEVSQAKGYTKFQENDILWAKITPCMQNGKCAVARGLKNGFGYGSTEFHVLRANPSTLPEYLYCFLRTKRLREAATAYFTGSAGQQRVGADFLKALTIPALPVASSNPGQMTQERLVAHIFECKRQIKALHREADALRQRAKKEFEDAVFQPPETSPDAESDVRGRI